MLTTDSSMRKTVFILYLPSKMEIHCIPGKDLPSMEVDLPSPKITLSIWCYTVSIYAYDSLIMLSTYSPITRKQLIRALLLDSGMLISDIAGTVFVLFCFVWSFSDSCSFLYFYNISLFHTNVMYLDHISPLSSLILIFPTCPSPSMSLFLVYMTHCIYLEN